MRVIAGARRGVRLEPPGKREKTRPTEDKLKEAVFNIIQPVKTGARVLDLFAGTGQIGIEFLSRGAEYCVFGEKSPGMVRTLRTNVEKSGFEEQAMILHADYRQVIARSPVSFDYVYLDPPFGFRMEYESIRMLRRLERVAPGGLIIVESAREGREEPDWPEVIEGYQPVFQRAYRSQVIRIFKEEA